MGKVEEMGREIEWGVVRGRCRKGIVWKGSWRDRVRENSNPLIFFDIKTMGEQETFIPTAFFRLGRYLSEVSNYYMP